MVTFFFVLSGFVMGIAYHGKVINNRSYWWARVARIMPVYLLAMALMLLSIYTQGESINILSLALNLSLLQSWFSPHPLTINIPGWSLSVEAFFYLTFPFLLRGIKNHNLSVSQMFAISISIWLLTQIITTIALTKGFYSGFPSLSHDLIFYFPLTHFCSFLLGVSGALWFIRTNISISNESASLLLFGSALLLIITILNNEVEISNSTGLSIAFSSSFYAPIFLIFIVTVGLCRSKSIKMLSSRPLVLLGEASFSLYILQVPAHQIYTKYISNMYALPPLQNFTLFFVLLTVASILSYLSFEKPAMKLIRYTLPVVAGRTANKYIKPSQKDSPLM